MIVQIIIGIFAASFLEWMVHKHILHELGKKKVSIFSFTILVRAETLYHIFK